MSLHSVSTQLKHVEKRLSRTKAGLLPVVSVEMPHDCPDADHERFKKEVKAAYPDHHYIFINYVSPNDGKKKYPSGRELAAGETWKLRP